MTALYKDGTITLVNGSPIITGNDTAWAVSLIVGGTVFVEVDGGNPLPILPDDGGAANLHPITDTQMTSAINWTGPSGTFNYALVRDISYTRQQALNAEKLGALLSQLDNPLMAALSSIEGMQDHLILLTGPSTATIIPRTSLVEGVDYDVAVNTLADRAAYNGEVKDFSVLVADAGNGRAAIYVKRSNTSGDWVNPVYITGAGGAPGQPGPFTTIQMGATTTLNPGQAATATLTPVSAGIVRLDLGLPRGVNGTGTGDFVGPNGGVTVNQLIGFSDATGKAGKGLTAAQARSASATPIGDFRNKIINPLFSINQRGVSGAVTLAAFAFGHDRMRAGANGCIYTFSTNNGVTSFNISAGSLQQIIEANAFAGEAGTYYLSWSGTAQGRIGTGAYGTSGNVFAATDANGAMIVEFGAGSLALPQLEKDYVTPFSGRAFPHELTLCQRYFVSAPLPLRGIVNATGTLAARLGGPLPVKMRAVPSVSITGGLYDGSGTANANGIQTNYSTADAVEADVVLTSALTVGRLVLLFAPSTVRADAELS